jgi:murein DD-endopeptidase MepM/ murein hydrolase activator NlpD
MADRRITPDEVKNLQLQPQASPVNKLMQYSPETGDAVRLAQLANTMNGLAKLGAGIEAADNAWVRNSYADMKAAAEKTELKNRNDWKEVSKNIKGMAIFNPYNHDAFEQLQFNQTADQKVLELSTIEDADKLDPNVYAQHIEDKRNELLNYAKDTGFKGNNINVGLANFGANVNKLKEKQAEDYAKYNFQVEQNKFTATTSLEMATVGLQTKGDKTGALTNVLDKYNKQMTELGWASDTKANVLLKSAADYAANNADTVNSSELEVAFKNLKIDGKTLNEIDPTYSTTLHQVIRQAKQAIYQDKQDTWNNHKLDMEIATTNTMSKFFKYYNQNRNATPEQLYQTGMKMINDAGIYEKGNEFLNYISNIKNSAYSIKDIKSDPNIVRNLQIKAAEGTLTGTDVSQNIGSLSGDDAYKLMNYIDRQEQKAHTQEVKLTNDSYKQFNKDYGTKNGMNYIAHKQTRNKVLNEAATYKSMFDSGKIDHQTYNQYMWYLKQGVSQGQTDYHKTQGLVSLVNEPHNLTQQDFNRVSVFKDLGAIRRMGITRYKNAPDKRVYISSKPQNFRTATGTRHYGYDLGGDGTAYGRALYSPMKGKVVFSGYQNGAGNMVIVQCSNGKYVKYMHLTSANSVQTGQVVTANTPIGRSGSSGRVIGSGGHVHVEFYDNQKRWITANEFLNS